ncbi:MFS transporter [Sneathiella chinensis]|uniref:MFS transporter n=1 Tax=Sneathiella chinensis TaxID=349750 RepID=A0ABQ5U4X7_9PROT|nr:MFS transporter [Sneathiella chinensis]GLQ05531.1 MFS transporter [Sneathiella chinensis]
MQMTPDRPLSSFDRKLASFPFYYGWVVVAIVFVTMGVGVNVRTSFSLLYPSILDEFGWDRGTTAAVFTIGFIGGGLFSPLIGRFMDVSSPRYLLSLSALAVSCGLILSTYSTEPWHLYLSLGVMMIGMGVVMTYVGHAMFLPNWFQRKRGLAVGLAFSGVGFGSIVLMPLLQETILEQGWRQACWGMAVLLLVVVLPLNFFLQRKHPAEIGLMPDGDPRPTLSEQGEEASPLQDYTIVDRNWAATDWSLSRAMRTGAFWWLCLTCCTGLYVWYAVQVHQTRYLVEIGISPIEASFALGLVGFAGVVGQVFLGHLSDALGREWIWTIASGGFALCYFFLLLMEYQASPFFLYGMVLTQGVLGYALASVFGSMPADLFQGRSYGTILGVVSLIALMGGGAGPWVTGLLYDLTGNYRAGFGVALVMCGISILGVWVTAPRKKRLVAGQARKRAAAAAAVSP